VGRDRIPDILILADAQRHKAHLFSYDQNMNKLAAKVGVAVLSVESSSCRSKKSFFPVSARLANTNSSGGKSY
jgi:hypothetical protein